MMANPVLAGPRLGDISSRMFGMQRAEALLTDPHAEEILDYHARLVTHGHVGWRELQPTQGVFDFTEWDEALAWLIAHGKLGLWHTGVWHVGQPSWLSTALAAISPANATATKALITAHFEGIQAHTGANMWPIKYFTTTNEVTTDSGYRATNWLAAYGSERFIDWAFIEARRLWPRLKLIFNEADEQYGGSVGAGRRAAILSYLTSALGRGVPIDAVGFEGHLRWNRQDMGAYSVIDTRALATFCQQIAALGLPVVVSELDCKPASGSGDPGVGVTRSEAISSRLTRHYLQTIANNCDLEAVVLWDWTDRYQFQDRGADWWRTGVWDRNLSLKRGRYDSLVAGLRG